MAETYIYNYRRLKPYHTPSGNPRHKVDVWRVKNNRPILIHANVDVGYRGKHAVVESIICKSRSKTGKCSLKNIKIYELRD